jgi:hypothetical protein
MTMNIRTTVISFLLMLGLVLTVAAQEARTNDESISSLKQQLTEVEAKGTQLRIRLEELNEQLKPECIERAVAGGLNPGRWLTTETKFRCSR